MTTRRAKPTKTEPWSARAAFEEGHHREVVERIHYPECSSEEAMARIGSLSFLGRLEEAKELWTLASPKLSGEQRARARFAMAIAHTRVSRFKSARRWLKENLADPETKARPESHQGLAIYHYYLGRFEKASSNARTALRAAMQIGDDYIRAFATDLYGHSLLQSGRRSAGLRLLNEARELSKSKTTADPYTPARLVYEAEAGLRPETMLEEIRVLLSSTLPEDTHTRSNLVLELARQLTLRGAWQEARTLLDTESHSIYSFENRRHEATLQLRLAELAYRQGDAAAATHFLQAARRCLNKIADLAFEIRIMGLEHKIERRFHQRDPAPESVARLNELSGTHGSPMSSRIRARIDGTPFSPAASLDEDPLGDLMDRLAARDASAQDELLAKGYLGLWPEIYGLAPTHEHLIVRESGDWLAVSRAGVEKSKSPLSALSRKLLNALAEGKASKEKLTKTVWSYEYDPLRHDPMIYAALAALRKSLGFAARWVLSHDEGWSLGPPPGSALGFSFLDESVAQEKRHRQTLQQRQQVEPKASLDGDATKDTAAPAAHDLNWRQLRALRESASREMWTVPDYKKTFKVSTMTAWRDLDGLMKTGYLTRIGRGRSTVYTSKEKTR